jgi:hypothetical protein
MIVTYVTSQKKIGWGMNLQGRTPSLEVAV